MSRWRHESRRNTLWANTLTFGLVDWFVPFWLFTSDTKEYTLGLYPNGEECDKYFRVMAVELSCMTQFCVMFFESILKSAYQDQTTEACQYIAGMLVSIADGLYSTPYFPRYKAGFQSLPHLLFNTTSADWAPIPFLKVMSS